MQFATQQNALVVAVFVVIAAFVPLVHAQSFAGTIIYSGRTCSGTPLVVSVIYSINCEEVECLVFIAGGTTYSTTTSCEKINRQTYVVNKFADSNYVMIETFADKCKGFMGAIAFLANRDCLVYDDQGTNYVVAEVNEDGSVSVGIYNDSSCTGAPFLGCEPDSETVVNRSCYKDYSIIYTGGGSSSNEADSTATGSISSSGSLLSANGSSDVSDHDTVGTPTHNERGSESDGGTIVPITPFEKSEGINTGAIVGILVAYVILCAASCILCMDRIERFFRRLGLRR